MLQRPPRRVRLTYGHRWKVLLPCHIERKSLPTDGQLDLSFYRSMWQSHRPAAHLDSRHGSCAPQRRAAGQLDTGIFIRKPPWNWACHSCAAHSPRSLMAWALSLPETDARSTREFFDTVGDDSS